MPLPCAVYTARYYGVMSNAAKNKNLKNLDKLISLEVAEMAQHESAGRAHMVLACKNAISDLTYRRELMAAR